MCRKQKRFAIDTNRCRLELVDGALSGNSGAEGIRGENADDASVNSEFETLDQAFDAF
jgi:hypothetical protein